MDEKLIIEALSPIERALLQNLKKKFSNLDEIAEKSSQDKSTAFRAITFLENKKLIEKRVNEKRIVDIGILGIHYLKKRLPERALLNNVAEKRKLPIGEIKNVCNLNDNEAKIALGTLKKKALISIKEGKLELSASQGEITKKMPEELFLEKLPLEFDSLEPEEKFALENLKSRKEIVEIQDQKIIEVKLTKLGEKISSMNLSEKLIEQLTPKLLKQNGWKGKKFRRYDLNSQAPRIYGGKRHFVNQATDYAKNLWLEMGFKEMTGKMTTTGYWNFDTLFTAQDHPVREEQDTFYIKDKTGTLPGNEETENVKKAHEGKIKNSKGWQYEWTPTDAKKVVLRTHTTYLSMQKLREIAKTKEFPAKYFALGKCFRNETVDWSHGFEFNQTEGIVVDENANFRQLLGYLKEFFKKMGFEKIRIRPGYFPYTEPSLEIDAFHPTRKVWVELGGAGMFRPEVTIPIFGKHIPVLAWGPGFDRIIMEFYKIQDLREMYKNDLSKLREMKFWRR